MTRNNGTFKSPHERLSAEGYSPEMRLENRTKISTAEKPLFRHPSNDVVCARIVAQSFPSNKSNPTMEKAKQEFRRKYQCDLRGMKTGQTDKL